MAHTHTHDHHHHGHAHPHGHSHAPHAHPAQTAHWSILRMPVPARLSAALMVSACLWAVIWLAMR